MMAVALEKSFSATVLDDSRYYKWYAVTWNTRNGVYHGDYYLMHPCKNAELKNFYPYEDEFTKRKVEQKIANNQFYCLDTEKMDVELVGSMFKNFNYRSLSIFIAPCVSRVVDYYGIVHGGGEDCVQDQKDVEAYFGAYNILLYHNFVEFNQDKYGKDSVTKKSGISLR